MTSLDVRPAPVPATDGLDRMLWRAAQGDVGSFMSFYDATVRVAHGYARLRHADPAAAERAVGAAYERAWRGIAGRAGSGLSPLAWLLHDTHWS